MHACGSRQACVISLIKICSICFSACAMRNPQVCSAACCPQVWACWCCLRCRLPVLTLPPARAVVCLSCCQPSLAAMCPYGCLVCAALLAVHAIDCWPPARIAAACPDGSCSPLAAVDFCACHLHALPCSCEPGVLGTCRGAVPQVNLSVLNKPVINSTLPTNVTTSNSTTLTFTTAKNTTTVICWLLLAWDACFEQDPAAKLELDIKAIASAAAFCGTCTRCLRRLC